MTATEHASTTGFRASDLAQGTTTSATVRLGVAEHANPLVRPDATRTFRAMASDVTIRVVAPTMAAGAALDRAEQVFHDVETACTRFDPTSALMRVNADPDAWHVVPGVCFDAIAMAADAHRATDGRFDPRVLRALESIGYDRSLPFEHEQVSVDRPAPVEPDAASAPGPWMPGLDAARTAVRVGPHPIDLGGIGKGLAVRWAVEELVGAGSAALVEAGGDCYLAGAGPDGGGWLVAVEDPSGGDDPVAVLNLSDRACATSSLRVRRWRADGAPVHHLIDPSTGRPGGEGLLAVSVVDADPASAEVWSKSLFLCGRSGIRAAAEAHGAPALWVDVDGRLDCTDDMAALMVWRADR